MSYCLYIFKKFGVGTVVRFHLKIIVTIYCMWGIRELAVQTLFFVYVLASPVEDLAQRGVVLCVLVSR